MSALTARNGGNREVEAMGGGSGWRRWVEAMGGCCVFVNVKYDSVFNTHNMDVFTVIISFNDPDLLTRIILSR